MSNARIVETLNAIADQLNSGEISVSAFTDQLMGHTNAIDNIPYALTIEARQVWAQLDNAIRQGNESRVAGQPLVNWLRDWTSRVPFDNSESEND